MSRTEKRVAAWLTALREDGAYQDLPDPWWLAEKLGKEGYLMPDLPEMKERYGTVQNDWVRVDDDGVLWIRYWVDDRPLIPTEAHALALALLAAADHAEVQE